MEGERVRLPSAETSSPTLLPIGRSAAPVLGAAVAVVVAFALFGAGVSRAPAAVAAAVVGATALTLALLRPDWGLAILVFAIYVEFLTIAIGLRFVILASALLWLHRRNEEPSNWNRAIGRFAPYGAVLIVSTLLSPESPQGASPSLGFLAHFALDLVLVIAIVLVVRSFAALRVITLAMLAAVVFVGLVAVVQFVTATFDKSYFGLAYSQIQQIVLDVHGGRVGGPHGDPNFFAQSLLVTLPLAVERVLDARERWERVFGAVAFVVALLAIVFTSSRGAIVAIAVMFVAMLWHWRPSPRAIAGIVGTAALLIAFLPSTYTARIRTTPAALVSPGKTAVTWENPDPSVVERSRVAVAGVRMAAEHPLLGVGPGNFEFRVNDYSPSASQDATRDPLAAHDMYLQVVAETGFLGLAALAVIVVPALWPRRRPRGARGEVDEVLWAYQLGLVGFLIAGAFLHLENTSLFWMLIAIVFAARTLADGSPGGLRPVPRRGRRRGLAPVGTS